MGDAYVSLTEIFEMRLDGLNSNELLALLLTSCEFLINHKNSSETFNGIFTPDTVFLTRKGEVVIELISPSAGEEELVPPELRIKRNETPIGDAQMVWCLGEMAARAAQPELADASILSLLNLMTLNAAVSASRPTLPKLAQILRNRSNNSTAEKMRIIIAALYQELMGDIDELINDQFCDEIRFSSTRSSLSIVNGALRRRNSNASSASSLTSNTSVRRRRKEIARKMAASVDYNFIKVDMLKNDDSENKNNYRNQYDNNEDDRSTVVDELDMLLATPLASPSIQRRCETRNLFITSNQTPENITLNGCDNYGYSDNDDEIENKNNTHKNMEATVEVEVHAPRANALGDYVALTNAQNYSNAASARKRSAQNVRQKSDLESFLNGINKIEPYESTRKIIPLSSAEDEADLTVAPSSKIISEEITNTKDQQVIAQPFEFSRQNSLYLSQIQRRVVSQENDKQKNHSQSPSTTLMKEMNNSTLNAVRRTLSSNFAVPEFLAKSTMPLIRLRAQSTKRKKVLLHRNDDALVLVKLLTGQCVEVNCKTDTIVSNIFETVATHLNITEHLFFGLALLKNSEYYFLDADRRLEKWAPPGWKSSAATARHHRTNSTTNVTRSGVNSLLTGGTNTMQRSASSLATLTAGLNNTAIDYCLHLRFRYYPRKLEFVKTESTTHNLYLQLRQDILDGVLRFNDSAAVNVVCELAALALQAEFGPAVENNNIGMKDAYFKMDNYLPTNFYAPSDTTACLSLEDLEARIRACHIALQNLTHVEAERAFISRCQAALGYGAHYYRVSKIKPSSAKHVAYFNRLADIHRLSIMPLGIAICREQTTTGARHVQAAYEWHAIRTLQFDRTRILISTVETVRTENTENNETVVVDHVFYTDHYLKSAYLVKFAASQHRFMIKMRQWQSTLTRVRNNIGNSPKRQGDCVNVLLRGKEAEVDSGIHEKENFRFPLKIIPKQAPSERPEVEHHKTSQSIVDAHLDRYRPSQALINSNSESIVSSLPSEEQKCLNNEIDADYLRYCYGAEAQTLSVTLSKYPNSGLGLTLVDGIVNCVRGVYVKSVSEEGDGKRKGLRIGDCLLKINGTSLFNASRHDAVELVRRCENSVDLEILRFPSITEALAETTSTNESSPTKNSLNDSQDKNFDTNSNNGLQRHNSTGKNISGTTRATFTTQKQRKLSEKFKKYSQRAVSDFGAIGDNLPVLNSDELIIETLERQKHRNDPSGLDVSLSLSPSSSSDTDDGETTQNAERENLAQSPRVIRRGKYDLSGAATSMYNTIHADEDDDNCTNIEIGNNQQKAIERRRPNPFLVNGKDDFEDTISWATAFDTTTLRSYTSAKRLQKHRKNTLDWTNDLSDIDDGENGSGSLSRNSPSQTEILQVEMHHAFIGQPLGFQIGSVISNEINSNEKRTIFVVKEIMTMPAAGVNLKVNDVILSINGTRLTNCSHERVVELLRAANSRVVLEIERQRKNENDDDKATKYQKMHNKSKQTIHITLDKSRSSSIGLSLAKRMGHDGIFIRFIAPGSLADAPSSENDPDTKRLQIGDRIWAINGECVANESSTEIVRRLTNVDGIFEICVKRIGDSK